MKCWAGREIYADMTDFLAHHHYDDGSVCRHYEFNNPNRKPPFVPDALSQWAMNLTWPKQEDK